MQSSRCGKISVVRIACICHLVILEKISDVGIIRGCHKDIGQSVKVA